MLTFSSPCKISVLENLVISMLRACVFKWLFLSLFNQIGSVSVILLIRKRSPWKRICFHSHKIIEMGKRRVRLVVFVRHGANIYNHLSVRKMDGFGIVTEWSCRLTLPMIFRRSNVLVVTMSASWWNIHQKTDQVTDWRNRARGSAAFPNRRRRTSCRWSWKRCTAGSLVVARNENFTSTTRMEVGV